MNKLGSKLGRKCQSHPLLDSKTLTKQPLNLFYATGPSMCVGSAFYCLRRFPFPFTDILFLLPSFSNGLAVVRLDLYYHVGHLRHFKLHSRKLASHSLYR
jgi:hypothetical protein